MTKNKDQKTSGDMVTTGAGTVPADPFAAFAIERKVTMPLLKQAEGEKVAVYFVSNIYRGRELKQARGGVQREKPADLANVMNLITGELQSFICAALVKSELTENYPNDGYVGKAFIIERGPKKQGGARAYNTYNVTEVKVPAGVKVPPTEKIADKSSDPAPAAA